MKTLFYIGSDNTIYWGVGNERRYKKVSPELIRAFECALRQGELDIKNKFKELLNIEDSIDERIGTHIDMFHNG
jgi:hypothetical protein